MEWQCKVLCGEAAYSPFQPPPPHHRCLHRPAAAAVRQSAGPSSQGLSPGVREASDVKAKNQNKPQQKKNKNKHRMHPGKYRVWVNGCVGVEKKKQANVNYVGQKNQAWWRKKSS